MSKLSYLIDPAGDGIIQGANLLVYPDGVAPYVPLEDQVSTSRTFNGGIYYGSIYPQLSYSLEATLTADEFNRLYSLINYLKDKAYKGLNGEVVVYNLAQPFSEVGTVRTRKAVPSTPITEENLGSAKRFTYWIAQQGLLSLPSFYRYGNLYKVSLNFLEGSILTP